MTFHPIDFVNVLSGSRSHARTDSLLLLFPFKRANAKSKNQTKTGTIPRRNPAWCSPTSNAERSSPSSRRTNAHPRRCRSPFPSSWAWSLRPSATSSWMPGAAAWRSGRTIWARGAPRPPPAPVPKRDGRTLSWAQVTSKWGQKIPKENAKEKDAGFLAGALHWWFESTILLKRKFYSSCNHRPGVLFVRWFLVAMESKCKLKTNLFEPDIVLWASTLSTSETQMGPFCSKSVSVWCQSSSGLLRMSTVPLWVLPASCSRSSRE